MTHKEFQQVLVYLVKIDWVHLSYDLLPGARADQTHVFPATPAEWLAHPWNPPGGLVLADLDAYLPDVDVPNGWNPPEGRWVRHESTPWPTGDPSASPKPDWSVLEAHRVWLAHPDQATVLAQAGLGDQAETVYQRIRQRLLTFSRTELESFDVTQGSLWVP